MPTIHRSGPYRFFFYASDSDEPVHVHIERGNAVSKFWIKPVRIATSMGFSQKELRVISRLVRKEQIRIERKWNEFFGNS